MGLEYCNIDLLTLIDLRAKYKKDIIVLKTNIPSFHYSIIP